MKITIGQEEPERRMRVGYQVETAEHHSGDFNKYTFSRSVIF